MLFNGHGDVVQTAAADGTVENSYDYDIFGNATLTIEKYTNGIRYGSEYFDNETGLYYLRARYYDSYQGRFISEDSFLGNEEDPLSLNLYTYCGNDPIMNSDPSGHQWRSEDGNSTSSSNSSGASSSYLLVGSTGSSVVDLQTKLKAAGISVSVDGDFGPATKAAVMQYQQSHGLTVDGIVGNQTMTSLNAANYINSNPSIPVAVTQSIQSAADKTSTGSLQSAAPTVPVKSSDNNRPAPKPVVYGPPAPQVTSKPSSANNNDDGQAHGVLAALGNAISTRINNAVSTYVNAISNDYLKNVGQQGYDGTIYVTDAQLKQANALGFVSAVAASDAMIGASSSLLPKSGDSVIFGTGSGNVTGTTSGGRLGNAATRAQNEQIANYLKANGYKITGGGGELPEEYLPGINGARKGSNYLDITAEKNGQTIRINTVDTYKNGLPTTREQNAANLIKFKTQDVILIPKGAGLGNLPNIIQ
jgi:RHS repeat-associated protein